ncbi:hypothetical protein WAI453_013090 [Rhynchosporium graminicola]
MPWTHDTPTRVRFKTFLEEGYSQRDAARKLGISRSSVQYFINHADRLVKPPGHYNRRILTLRQIRQQFSLDCSDLTLLRAFQRHGYHYHIPDCAYKVAYA